MKGTDGQTQRENEMDYLTWLKELVARLDEQTGIGDLYLLSYAHEIRDFYECGRTVDDTVTAILAF
jgi:hypothetical protein